MEKLQKKNLIIIGSIILVLLAGTVIWFLVRSNKSASSNEKSCLVGKTFDGIESTYGARYEYCMTKTGEVFVRYEKLNRDMGIQNGSWRNPDTAINEKLYSEAGFELKFDEKISSIGNYFFSNGSTGMMIVISESGKSFLIDLDEIDSKGIAKVDVNYDIPEKVVSFKAPDNSVEMNMENGINQMTTVKTESNKEYVIWPKKEIDHIEVDKSFQLKDEYNKEISIANERFMQQMNRD